MIRPTLFRYYWVVRNAADCCDQLKVQFHLVLRLEIKLHNFI